MNLFCKLMLPFLILPLWPGAPAPGFPNHARSQYQTFQNKPYAYLDFPLPEGILVYQMDKQKLNLEVKGLTLIQIWSRDAGSEGVHWERARAVEARYKDRGLTTISVNFENGMGFKYQHRWLKQFFQKTPLPEHFYFDALGYTVDLLKIPGFPTWFLVDEQGTVVFRTNGKNEEGLAILESEIETRLK